MILDTNALSALADGDDALGDLLGSTPLLALPVIVLGEYGYGIRASRRRARYETWLKEILPAFQVLALDEGTAAAYADLRQELKTAGRPVPENDLWIAALARQHRLPVVSRDLHFANIPQLKHLAW